MNLSGRTARAAVWAMASTLGSKGVTLIGLSILARILAPREFGLLAFAMVYITYAETIGDLGSGMALVYWPDRREEAAQVTFIVNAIGGIFWCAITLLIAPMVAAFFHAPNGTAIIRVLAWSFAIKFLGTTHDALAQKDLRFRARIVPELGQAGLKAIVAIILAWRGYGAWSLVWGHLIGQACWTILLWVVVPWRPTWSIPRDLIKPMLGYGRAIIVLNVFGAIVSNADLLIVGRMLGATALGLYQMAEKMPDATVIVIVRVLSKVLFPAFSRLHAAGENVKDAYLTASRYAATITVPAALGMFVLADPIVRVSFGPAWLGAIPILRAFSIYAGIRALTTYDGDLLKATGHARLLAMLSIMKAVALIPALISGARYSATAVAWAMAVVMTLTAVITLAMAAKILNLRPADFAHAFGPSVAAGGLMALAVVPWTRFGPKINAPVDLACGVLLGAIVYLVALRLFDPALYQAVRDRIFRRGEPAALQPVE